MKYIIFLYIIFTYVLFSCSSMKTGENDYLKYYSKVSKADSLFYLKKYEQTNRLLSNLFNHLTPLNTFRFNEYYKFLITKHFLYNQISKKEISSLIEKYGYTDIKLKNDSLLSNYFSEFITKEEYVKLREKYHNKIDKNLRIEIANMLTKDQDIRNNIDFNIEKAKKVDIDNSLKLKDLFDNDIYPSKEVIGGLFYDELDADIETLLLHSNDSDRFDYFLPKIKKFIKQGKTNPYIYAMLVDQHQLFNKKKQLYGTYNIANLNKNDFNFYNKNRIKLNIGLPSIEFDVWRDSIIKNK